MTLKQFLKTPEADKLRKMYFDYNDSTDKWNAPHWRRRCIQWAVIITALDLFLDEDQFNCLCVRDDVTADDIWKSVNKWAENNDSAGILTNNDALRATQFDEAFAEVRSDENELFKKD